MKGRLRKFFNWWFGVKEDQPKNERLLFILSMSMYYLNIVFICLPKKKNYDVTEDYNWAPFFVVLLLQLILGIAYRVVRHRRLKRSQV